jgi:hypothetical protein
LAYFLAALIPIITFSIMDAAGIPIGALIYLAVAVVLAIPIFIAAASVSRKY